MGKLLRFNDALYTHFVTFKTQGNFPFFEDENCCKKFIEVLEKIKKELEFELLAYCVMPDHVHLLIESAVDANEFASIQCVNNHHLDRADFNLPKVMNVTCRPPVKIDSPLITGANEFAPIQGVDINKQIKNVDFNSLGVVNNQLSDRADFNLPQPTNVTSKVNRSDISYIIKRIKGGSAKLINEYLENEGIFWQKTFYDFPVYSEKKLVQKINYIHNNPVVAGLVKNCEDYPWSSAFYYN